MNKIQQKSYRWIIVAVVIVVGLFLIFRFVSLKRNELPKGIASGNGRIEAQLVDIAPKEPLRVEKILVDEGDLVKAGQTLVLLNIATLEAQLAEAKGNVAAAQKNLAMVNASILSRRSELKLAKIEANRTHNLLKDSAGSQREYDMRRNQLETAIAALAQEQASYQEAKQKVEVAFASQATIQTQINDATLYSPVLGRVLYRLAQPGEVLGAGSSALTLVNLGDVYMEIFLPSNQAAALKIGSEARIALDYIPNRVIPATVSFVSPEAQFTPKQVETKSEREMLMFRVKLQIPKKFVTNYIKQIKTGVRGVGYVKIDQSAEWPTWLDNVMTAESWQHSDSEYANLQSNSDPLPSGRASSDQKYTESSSEPQPSGRDSADTQSFQAPAVKVDLIPPTGNQTAKKRSVPLPANSRTQTVREVSNTTPTVRVEIIVKQSKD